MQSLILFNVGEINFGMALELTQSIHRAGTLPQKTSSEYPGGFLTLDGEQVPLCDLAVIFAMETPTDRLAEKKLMVVGAGDQTVALIVDRVGRVVSVQNGQIESLPPVFKGWALDCFPQVLAQENEMILLLKPEGIRSIVQH